MTDRQLPPSSPGQTRRPAAVWRHVVLRRPHGALRNLPSPIVPPDDQAASRRCRPGSSARPRFPGRMAAPTRIRLRGSPPRRRRRRPLPLPSPWAAAWSSRRRCSAWSRSARTSSRARPTASRSCARRRPLPRRRAGAALAAPIGPPSIPDVGQGGDADAKGSDAPAVDAAATDETGAKGLPHGWDPSAGYAVAEEDVLPAVRRGHGRLRPAGAYGLRRGLPPVRSAISTIWTPPTEPSATQP